MKDFFEKLMSGDDSQAFTKFELVVYGILIPLGLIAIMGIAGWIEGCCQG